MAKSKVELNELETLVAEEGEEAIAGRLVRVQPDDGIGEPFVAKVISWNEETGFMVRQLGKTEKHNVGIDQMQLMEGHQVTGMHSLDRAAGKKTESFHSAGQHALHGKQGKQKEQEGESFSSKKRKRPHRRPSSSSESSQSSSESSSSSSESASSGKHRRKRRKLKDKTEKHGSRSLTKKVKSMEEARQLQTWFADMKAGMSPGGFFENVQQAESLMAEDKVPTLKLGLYKMACVSKLFYEGTDVKGVVHTQVAKLATEFDVQKEKADFKKAMRGMQKAFHQSLAGAVHFRKNVVRTWRVDQL